MNSQLSLRMLLNRANKWFATTDITAMYSWIKDRKRLEWVYAFYGTTQNVISSILLFASQVSGLIAILGP